MVRLLLVRAIVPLAVIVAVPLVGASVFAVQHLRMSRQKQRRGAFYSAQYWDFPSKKQSGRTQRQTLRAVISVGVLKWLPVSLVLAFCFTPSVSANIFQAWYCLPYAYDDLDPHSEQWFLASDLSVRCDGFESGERVKILAVAWLMVCVWPVGMVILFAAVLFPCRYMILDETWHSPLMRATRFLHRDYKPEYCWWEVASLMQRTILTGWLQLIDSELQFIRLVVAHIVSIFFLVAILACHPYKSRMDYGMAAGCQLLFVCVFLGGIIVRLYEDIATDVAGSRALAYRFLGLHSSEEAVVIMIFVAFANLGLLIFTLSADSYLHIVQKRLKRKWSVVTMDPPSIRWKPRGVYACFLSHYKMEAASDARYIHDLLRNMLQAPVFLEYLCRTRTAVNLHVLAD